MSTQAVMEIGELLTKTHHVDPLTERYDSTNNVIKRITLKHKEK
jgi:hypothetical protein